MCTTCDFPFILNCFIIVYCITLIALFTNFYIETYRHQSRDRAAAAAALQIKQAALANGHANGGVTAKKPIESGEPGSARNGSALNSNNKNGVILNSSVSSNGTTQVYQRHW
ncbi:unnamed protein product [Allacma fusca]|uniref:Uncharacterized protein n=1 Tax=Allacma fusca TaxID=39272 RepID=A0A8J2KNR0_9HEXA|nr:unnamed protein product [Allacma fusca]